MFIWIKLEEIFNIFSAHSIEKCFQVDFLVAVRKMFSSGIVILCLSDTDDEDVEEDEDMMVADEAVDDDYDDEDIDESEQEDEETWNNLR